jgi:hypothetical protein
MTIVVIGVLAFGGYHLYANSGKMSARELETEFSAKSSTWGTSHFRCRTDPRHDWDYLCTDPELRSSYGIDVNRAGITKTEKLP